jgi:FAD/FMN-containing dehydrogenase
VDGPIADQLRAEGVLGLIESSHPDYEVARRVWNADIDRRPALIVRCSGVADVIAAVNVAREARLSVAIRGGGHNAAGYATCEGGMV